MTSIILGVIFQGSPEKVISLREQFSSTLPTYPSSSRQENIQPIYHKCEKCELDCSCQCLREELLESASNK